MNIVEIKPFDNGGHRNQGWNGALIPDGWAVVPDDMETPNFPFGKIEVKEIDGVTTVTKWTAIAVPEVKEEERPISKTEQLRADIDYIAIMTGVEL